MVKKSILAIAIAAFSMSVFAQKIDEVTLVVSGEAPTKQEATTIALRSAIEQTFGVFVSANTQILNDQLIKDEIATVSSGNVKEYKEIAVATLPNGNTAVTLETVISVSKLVSYAQSKGSSAEFSGASFGMNMKLRELNKANEEKVISHMISQFKQQIPTLYDYELELGEPRLPYDGKAVYEIPAKVLAISNKNMENIKDICTKTLNALSLSSQEVADYKTANMSIYALDTGNRYSSGQTYKLRSELSTELITSFFERRIDDAVFDFQIVDNLNGISMPTHNKCIMAKPGLLTYCDGVYRNSYEDGLFPRPEYSIDIRLQIPQNDISKYNNFTITHKTNNNIKNARFLSSKTWKVGKQEWSDAVVFESCKKSSMMHEIPCRSNPPYGDLFSWYMVRGCGDVLCPNGWRVPTTADFKALNLALGGTDVGVGRGYTNTAVRDKLVGTASGHWGGAYGCCCYSDGTLYGQGSTALYWSQSEINADDGYNLGFSSSGYIYPQFNYNKFSSKDYGFTLRCVRKLVFGTS